MSKWYFYSDRLLLKMLLLLNMPLAHLLVWSSSLFISAGRGRHIFPALVTEVPPELAVSFWIVPATDSYQGKSMAFSTAQPAVGRKWHSFVWVYLKYSLTRHWRTVKKNAFHDDNCTVVALLIKKPNHCWCKAFSWTIYTAWPKKKLSFRFKWTNCSVMI